MDAIRNKKNLWLLYETEVPHRRFCDAAYGVSPAEELSLENLKLLRHAFSSAEAGEQLQDGRSRRSRRSRSSRGGGGGGEERGMQFEEFRDVLRSVIGPDVGEAWLERFFNEVDISMTGQVRWQQLCSYLLLEYSERERASIPTAALLDPHPKITHCSHNKREATVRVVAVSHPPPLRYLSVSKAGRISVWSGDLHILRTLSLAGDQTEEVANTQRFRGWTTDAVYMSNVHKVAVATDNRDLHFINVSTASVFEDIHLFGLQCVPTALCYWHDNVQRSSLLLVGDEKGGVHLMWFLNPSRGLFKKPSKQQNVPHRIFFPDLSEHSDTVSHQYIPCIHRQPINRVMFDPSGGGDGVVMTSSECDTCSVAFSDLTAKRAPYVWKMNQGAKCFDYSASLQLLVTGGCDRAVRLWSRYITSRPVGALLGHRTAILDVAIYRPARQILSYSRDAELRVWDVSTHQCLRTVRLQFPCMQPGRVPDHGYFPFLLVTPPLPVETHAQLVVGCKDYLAQLRLADAVRGGGDCGRGAAAVSCALYNPTLRQVVTGHADSSVSLWDVETGRRGLRIRNAHGDDELTCMTLDSSHRRLVTGARSGTIKVWNLLNGLNLHKLEPASNSEVTRLTCLHDNRLLAVGWSQRIAQYDLAEAKDLYVRADMSWKSAGVHHSDILAVCQCAALGVVATASHDGEVVVWRLETQGPVVRLQGDRQAGVLPPVDGLLFLQQRATNRRLRHRGVLVSSQAGRLSFWGVSGQTHAYGGFYAPEQPGARVLSLTSDQLENTMLLSGDTTGRLQVWDISGYALDVQTDAVCRRPALLHSWRPHQGGVVGVEVLEVSHTLLVLTASADGCAGLWTRDGGHVGSFGQETMWSVTDAAVHQSRRETQDERGEDGEQEASGPSTAGGGATGERGWWWMSGSRGREESEHSSHSARLEAGARSGNVWLQTHACFFYDNLRRVTTSDRSNPCIYAMTSASLLDDIDHSSHR